MTPEDKRLLLKDLSARLPYKIKVKVSEVSYLVEFDIQMLSEMKNNNWYEYPIPYLRPMSSMTEEEKEEYHELCDSYYSVYFDSVNSIDWLNAHHFDYRGLIERNLAIEAPEGMYN